MKTFSLVFSLAVFTLIAKAAQTDITGPAGSGSFGTQVVTLSNGRFVVTDPFFDDGALTNVGAVYLFDVDGTLLSTLKGSTANDLVGLGAIVVTAGDNFIVSSSNWANGAATAAGAVTFGRGSTGFGAAVVVVSPSNSLVGSTINDSVGASGITVLTNGSYVVVSPVWDNPSPARADVGAVTWCPADGTRVGAVSATNSLVGGTVNDHVGNGVIALPSGNYLVRSFSWNNPSPVATSAGALTFGNGTTGVTGLVSTSNSLVGSSANDLISGGNIFILANGNYVVSAANWDNTAAKVDAGAAVWGSGATGVVGTITSSKALVGNTGGDRVGDRIVPLANGNYVVLSQFWDKPSPATVDAGVATWGNGSTGTTGVVSTTNSLVGSSASDRVGVDAIALTNGNYVVLSPLWNNGAAVDVGAATWCLGTVATTTTVSLGNSLVGTTNGDQVGRIGVALTNGNYVIGSNVWDNGAITDAGAATWGDGSTGIKGAVTPANSLIGKRFSDAIGTKLVALTNGNYLVISDICDNGTITDAGAVTWGNGTTGNVGVVNPGNSLMGGSNSDHVGETDVVTLTNGNYVVISSRWNNPSPVAARAGAVTWGNGTMGVMGIVSAANSLVGTTQDDVLGGNTTGLVKPLANGNYVVPSKRWNNPIGSIAEAGAVTFGNGSTGVKGVVSAANSLIGGTSFDNLGSDITTFANGVYVVRNNDWDNPAGPVFGAGAVTFGTGTSVQAGLITTATSVLGASGGAGGGLRFAYFLDGDELLVGKSSENKVTRFNRGPGKLTFEQKDTNVIEGNVLTLRVVRLGGSEGTLTVKVSTSSVGGTATAGTDYTAITNQLLTFGPGVVSQDVSVTINADAVVSEANETFKLVLSAASSPLGTLTSTVVHIVDGAIENTRPDVPVVTAPAANARVPVGPGGSITVTGTAKDDRGIESVAFKLNGASLFSPATITGMSGTSAKWSAVMTPQTGANTLEVISTDTSGNNSLVALHTFIVTRPLLVGQTAGKATFTAGFAPSSFREVGKLATVKVTPGSGFLFARWTLSGGASAADIGVTPAQLELPTISFLFKEGLQLIADLAPNPYTNTGLSGSYSGVIEADTGQPDRAPAGAGPEDGTLPSNSTTGGITLKVSTNGSFTGKLNIDGLSLSIAGTFDTDGIARFGSSRATTLSVARSGKPSLALELSLNLTIIDSGGLTGRVSEVGPTGPTAVSTIEADHPGYSSTTLVPGNFLGPSNATQNYTVILPSISTQPSGIATSEFPQGDGIGNLTLSKTGAISLSATLAEGTAFTLSGALNAGNFWRLFIPLYGKKGLFTGQLTFDTAPAANDITGFCSWHRPILDNQHYPNGWSDLKVNAFGCKYNAVAGRSVLSNLTVSHAATLTANLTGVVPSFSSFRAGTISAADVFTPTLALDPNFSLSISRSNGRISGKIPLSNNTVPTFLGIMQQKSSTPFASGFFKTETPKVKDYTGHVGNVLLVPQ